MLLKKYSKPLIFLTLVLLLAGLGMASACSVISGGATAETGLKTWMLVRAPDGPLPANRPVTVKSRTRDPQNHLSHVELYAIEIPDPINAGRTEKINLLIDTQFVPFEQTTFTANQTFIPVAPGEYVIKVVGYNLNQQKSESEFIRFAVQ